VEVVGKNFCERMGSEKRTYFLRGVPDAVLTFRSQKGLSITMSVATRLNVEPAIWGPYLWDLYHGLAAEIDLKRATFDRARDSFHTLIVLLPCPTCEKHALDTLEKLTQSSFDSKNTWLDWSITLRETIAKRVGRRAKTHAECVATGLAYREIARRELVTRWFDRAWTALIIMAAGLSDGAPATKRKAALHLGLVVLPDFFPNAVHALWSHHNQSWFDTNKQRFTFADSALFFRTYVATARAACQTTPTLSPAPADVIASLEQPPPPPPPPPPASNPRPNPPDEPVAANLFAPVNRIELQRSLSEPAPSQPAETQLSALQIGMIVLVSIAGLCCISSVLISIYIRKQKLKTPSPSDDLILTVPVVPAQFAE
jgi:hypothetical protein